MGTGEPATVAAGTVTLAARMSFAPRAGAAIGPSRPNATATGMKALKNNEEPERKPVCLGKMRMRDPQDDKKAAAVLIGSGAGRNLPSGFRP